MSSGNGIFQEDNTPDHRAQIVQEWFEEHNNKFQLISWQPNSLDLNLTKHIWVFIERQLRDKHLHFGIS
ncbi:hypothetical protein TNCV_3101381 [Trichonephila clavipes]|nr:hypothetical protein TNCV_3101381 [Trichonephila clavipes]